MMNTNISLKLPSHRAYLALALPLTISTITTPLLGAADTAIIGHLNNPAYLGGVAVGTLIFKISESIKFRYPLLIFLRNETHSTAKGRRQPFHLDTMYCCSDFLE
jgi:hypothetical protein